MQQVNSSFLKGFLIGAAIGAGAGMLLAPASGIETRARLGSMKGQVKSRASDLPGGVQHKVQDAASRSRGYLQGLRGRLSEAVEAGREAAHERRERLRAEVEAVTEPKPSI